MRGRMAGHKLFFLHPSEQVLLSLEGERYKEAGGVMFMPPLSPGDKLWPELVSEFERKRATEEAARQEAAAAAAAADAPPPAATGTEVGTLEELRPHTPVNAAESVAAEPPAAGGIVVVEPKTLLILNGMDSITKISAVGQQLSKRYNLPLATIDDLLFEGADTPPLPGMEPPVQGNTPATPAAAAAAPAKGGKPGQPANLPAALPGPEVPEDPTVPMPYDPFISDILYSRVLIDPDLESQPGFQPMHTKLQPHELHEYVVRGLRQALSHAPQFANGLVLTSLQSKYVDQATALKLLLEAARLRAVMAEANLADPKTTPKSAAKGGPAPTGPLLAVESWHGHNRVFLVQVSASKELVLQSLKEKAAVAAAAAAAKRAAEEEAARQVAAAAEAAAADAAEDERALAPSGKQHSRPPTPQAEPASPNGGAAGGVDDAEAAAAAEKEAKEAAIVEESEKLLEKYADTVTRVAEVVGKPPGTELPDGRITTNAVAVVNASAVPEMSEEQLLLAACGISFRMGVKNSVLPVIDSDAHLIPEPYCMQVGGAGGSVRGGFVCVCVCVCGGGVMGGMGGGLCVEVRWKGDAK